MKKKYITLEEVLAIRGTDTKIYDEKSKEMYVKFSGDVICIHNIKDDSIKAIGGSIMDIDKPYILEPEEFKIEHSGVYKTRDGRKAFVSLIRDVDNYSYPVVAIISGHIEATTWSIKGKRYDTKESDEDLVEYVGELK